MINIAVSSMLAGSHETGPVISFDAATPATSAMFAAIRRASSWLSNLAAERRPGSSSK
jgi:hypothetical protein